MAKQRKAGNTIGQQLAAAVTTAPKAAAPTQDPILVMGKRYRVKTNTKHAHDQHWDAICKALVDGPQSFSKLAALGLPVHATNSVPYVRYCVRRGWLVAQPQA